MDKKSTRQPPSLSVYFSTEMWERYGFYVVQSLLALYLALHLEWPDSRVYTLVGSFTAMTYLSPIIGGYIADYYIGQKKAILLGAACLLISYVTLVFVQQTYSLIASLAGIAVGTGLLKPNISSLLGNEYEPHSLERENGFTIFYMGLTTGIIMGTTLPSIINAHFGWSASFASAAFGMIIAFSIFYFGIKRYQIKDYQQHIITYSNLLKAGLLIFLIWGAAFYVMYSPWIANFSFMLVILLASLYLIKTIRTESKTQARQTLVIALLCTISVIFWAFYFQMFLSLTLFISRAVKPELMGIPFPAPYYVSIQSLGMLIFGYFLSRRVSEEKAHTGIETANKFLKAMLLMVVAYLLISGVASIPSGNTLYSPLLFIPAYLFISIAELLLSPVGLSAITRLADYQKVSTMMGIFFISLGVGAFLSGKLANLTALHEKDASLVAIKVHYAHTFSYLFFILLISTAICAALNMLIKRLLR